MLPLGLVVVALATSQTHYLDGSQHPEVRRILKSHRYVRNQHKKWQYEVPQSPQRITENEPSTPAAPNNYHKASINATYPKNLLYLLASFARGTGIPLSYSDVLPTTPPVSYWGTQTYLSVGAIDPYGNRVPLDSAIALQERTLTAYGLNLYDAATWEIGLALWNLHEVSWIYERNILYTSTTGPMGSDKGAPGGIIDIRADMASFKFGDSKVAGNELKKIATPGNVTHFNQKPDGSPDSTPVKEVAGAFYYRMIAPKYELIDPFLGNYANSFKVPWPNNDSTTPWNVYGEIHFNDWKPITGENVWGCIIGPLQNLFLATNGNLTNTTCGDPSHEPPEPCDFKTYKTTPPPVQQAITILPAFKALQSTLGSIFHCPWGSKLFPYDPSEGTNVSNENNFSSYAALKMLQAVLMNYTGGSSSDATLSYAIQTVNTMVKGMDNWFDNHLFSSKDVLPDGSKVVPQGGHIIDGVYQPVPVAAFGGLAVDCQTWGMTVLGAPRVDKLFGTRTAYGVWQATKKWAGYWKKDRTIIAGVGYTDLSGGGKNSTPVPNNKIWSAEWTFGAINMAQVLSQQYTDMGDSAAASSLLADAQSMYNEVTKLWNANNTEDGGLMFPDGSYVYANARFFIPWGWYANPISALCSTAWSVMQGQNFNPFELGGGNKPALKEPDHLHKLYYGNLDDE